MPDSRDWIERLGLIPHPEGGYYREVYRSKGSIPGEALPERFGGKPRPYGTSILFLLTGNSVSRLHRIGQDEIWNHHHGSGLLIHVFDPDGEYGMHRLGTGPDESPQLTVPAGCCFGAEVNGNGPFSLAGCTCCPGFTFDDLCMPSREELLALFPGRAGVITRLTPEPGVRHEA